MSDGHLVRSFEDDNVFIDDHVNAGFLPAALNQIKKVVTAFVGKLGIPFCNKKRIEEELSQSITQALLEASSYLDEDNSS